jgi:hypothetical protein
MPMFAAWADTRFFIASKERARKSRNLEVEPRCVITTDTGDLHLVIEGVARHVHDEAILQRAVAAFHAVYQWPTRCGQPAGRRLRRRDLGWPPVRGLRSHPNQGFGLPTDGETMTPTRWIWSAER